MITTPTVLVLGAGASHPYGFPTGAQLRRQICEAFSPTSGIAETVQAPYSEAGGGRYFELQDAFLKSAQPSIDAFLERRQTFLDVGKRAIAYCLIQYEDESKLYEARNPIPGENRGEDWYPYLWIKLDTSFERFSENRLSIITFNYDRSLEHYLLNALQHSHGRLREECAKALAQVPIIHVHGQLGRRPYLDDASRKYNPYLRPDPYHAVSEAAAGITLLHEEASGNLNKARELLAAAERIAFLGFGYHQANIKRIAIDTRGIASKHIVGTTRGLIGEEVNDVKRRIHAAFGSEMNAEDWDILHLLRAAMFLG